VHPFALSCPTGLQELSLEAIATRNCLILVQNIGGERDSNRIQTPSQISKLRIQKIIRSPRIPSKPHSCH
jgi:hypothetical protein